MSYVLDALKKSDQERERRTTPDIHSVHGTVEPKHKSRILWPYLLLLGLLLNAGLLVWWMHPWPSETSDQVAREIPAKEEQAAKADEPGRESPSNPLHLAAQRAEPSNPSAPKPKESKNRLPLPAETAPLPLASGSTGVERSQASSQSFAPPGDVAVRAGAPPGSDVEAGENKQLPAADVPFPDAIKKNAVKPEKAGPGLASAQKKPSVPLAADLLQERLRDINASADKERVAKAQAKTDPLKLHALPENEAGPVGDNLPPVGQARAIDRELHAAVESDSEAEKTVPQLHELPLPLRRDVPNLTFSMLVYSRNPAERIARINGQVVHEGQEVTAGLKLEHITPNGAIFSFRGYRFHKGVY